MKKHSYKFGPLQFLALAAALSACAGIERDPETANLFRLKREPIGCEYLYKVEVEKSALSQEDAEIYLENRIVAQAQRGNAYWLVSTSAGSRQWTPLGYHTTYMMTANVYTCPDKPNTIKYVSGKSGGKDSGQADKQTRK